jgi:hypothetical protein
VLKDGDIVVIAFVPKSTKISSLGQPPSEPNLENAAGREGQGGVATTMPPIVTVPPTAPGETTAPGATNAPGDTTASTVAGDTTPTTAATSTGDGTATSTP